MIQQHPDSRIMRQPAGDCLLLLAERSTARQLILATHVNCQVQLAVHWQVGVGRGILAGGYWQYSGRLQSQILTLTPLLYPFCLFAMYAAATSKPHV